MRAAAGNEVVDYLALDFSLSPGETLDNQTLSGHHFGSNVTFIVSFSLTCRANFYGSDCTVHCRPADSDELGHYSCLSDGRIQCLEGYRNETSNCTECVPAEGCRKLTSPHTPSLSVHCPLSPPEQAHVALQGSAGVLQATGEASVRKVRATLSGATHCLSCGGGNAMSSLTLSPSKLEQPH